MRRLFVIFLALLFPLNVFALSMSVSAHAPAPVVALGHAIDDRAIENASFDTGFMDTAGIDSQGGEAVCDIDPDEPPAGMDFHDTVHAASRLPSAAPPDSSVCSFVPSRHGRDPLPPIKPPPSA